MLTHTALVTWRQDHDDFFTTRLDFEWLEPAQAAYGAWSSLDWVLMAADAESERFDPERLFELISVVVVPFGQFVIAC